MTGKGILHAVGKTLKWSAIALALCAGSLLAINLLDEDPSPEAKSAIAASPDANADPANGFLALAGTNAPANEDFFSYGSQWVAAYNAAADHEAIAKAAQRFPYDALPFKGGDKLLCNPRKTPCLPQARERAEAWRKLASDNQISLERQRRLTEYAHFEETYRPQTIETPILGYRNQTRLLVLDLIALEAAEGRLDAALEALEARIAFDRRAFLGSRSFIMGMVATLWLGQDYALLGEIVAGRSPALAAQKARLYRMTEPLALEQVRSVAGQLFAGELGTQARSLLSLTPEVLRAQLAIEVDYSTIMLSWPFLKKQATINLLARRQAASQARIRDFAPERHEAWLAQARGEKQRDDDAVYSWRTVYNPVGKLVLVWAGLDGEPYVLRLSDLIGTTRLARLQVEAVTSGTTDAQMSARIAADKALYDPYSGKPLGWDEAQRRLYFDARGEIPQGAAKRIGVGV